MEKYINKKQKNKTSTSGPTSLLCEAGIQLDSAAGFFDRGTWIELALLLAGDMLGRGPGGFAYGALGQDSPNPGRASQAQQPPVRASVLAAQVPGAVGPRPVLAKLLRRTSLDRAKRRPAAPPNGKVSKEPMSPSPCTSPPLHQGRVPLPGLVSS